MPTLVIQDALAGRLAAASQQRDNALKTANEAWKHELQGIEQILRGVELPVQDALQPLGGSSTETEIRRILAELPPLTTDNSKEEPEAENKEFSYDESR